MRGRVAVACALVGLALPGCGGGGDPTVTVRGTFTVPCVLDDVTPENRAAVVFAPDGTQIGLGYLDLAVVKGPTCVHRFTVMGVPDQYSRYQIKVDSEPRLPFPRAQLGDVKISIEVVAAG